MFAHAYMILGIVVAAFLAAKVLRLSTELSMLAAAFAAAVYHGVVWSGEFPLRHIVEGTFTYFDVCLIFISATFFMALVKESGGVAFIVRRIVGAFHSHRFICLLLLTFVMLIPGALTGSGATSVLTVGALVGSVLSAMGVDETRKAAAIFMTAAMSAAAPPINLWAMMAAAGANMPYVGFNGPLAVLSLLGALFSMFWLAGRASSDAHISREDALARLPEAPEGMNWLRVLLPFVVFGGLLAAGRIWPFDFPIIGLPMIFMLSACMVWLLSPVKLRVWRVLSDTVRNLLPLVGIMVVVGALIQILALSGARGVISLHVVILPLTTLFATLFIILPVSEGILQYAVAPLLGVPLIMLFNMKGMDPIVALSAMSVLWPLGDCLPPTAVIGRAAVMELHYEGRYYSDFVRACLIPMLFIAVCCTLFLIYSKQLAFLAV
ncbi:MAG: C4-dicarboxylate ABC transporter [Fretibacterium sp.]|nr:C4-dicarboxylate ABC transporter [Fretibacterium sp.]